MEYFEHLDPRTCEYCKKSLNSSENYVKALCINYHIICNECLDKNRATTDQPSSCLISCPSCKVKFDDRYLMGDLLQMLKQAAKEAKLNSSKITGLLGLVASFKQQINILFDKLLQSKRSVMVENGRSASLERQKNKILQQVKTNLTQAIYTIDKISCKKKYSSPILFSSKTVQNYNDKLININNLVNRYLIEAQLQQKQKLREKQLFELQNYEIFKKRSYNIQEELQRQKKQKCKRSPGREMFTPKKHQNQNRNNQNNSSFFNNDDIFLEQPSQKAKSQKPNNQCQGKQQNKSGMEHLINELLSSQDYLSEIKQQIHFISRVQRGIMTKDQPIIEQQK